MSSQNDNSFNGATSNRTWKPGTQGDHVGAHGASMGPRPIGRGNIMTADDLKIIIELQWGHVQSDVETAIGADIVAATGKLQWGHVQSDVETR